MARRSISIGAALVLLTGVGVATGDAAQAAYTNCPTGYACFWDDPNYVTLLAGADADRSLVRFENSFSNFQSARYSYANYGANDSASSITNNGRYYNAMFYVDAGCSGYLFTLEPGGERDPNLGNGIDTRNDPAKYALNDSLSSGRFASAQCL